MYSLYSVKITLKSKKNTIILKTYDTLKHKLCQINYALL